MDLCTGLPTSSTQSPPCRASSARTTRPTNYDIHQSKMALRRILHLFRSHMCPPRGIGSRGVTSRLVVGQAACMGASSGGLIPSFGQDTKLSVECHRRRTGGRLEVYNSSLGGVFYHCGYHSCIGCSAGKTDSSNSIYKTTKEQ